MTSNAEEIFKSMNASKILVAILETIKSVEISTDTFLNANNQDRELAVDYDNEKQAFTFSLKQEESSADTTDSN